MHVISQTSIFEMYIFGFAMSFVIQSLMQTKFGNESNWGTNRGWQNEIAIWNVFAILALVAMVMRNFESDLVVFALLIMSVGFFVNHFLAIKQGHKSKSHLAGATANACGILMIVIWFFFSHR